MEPREKAKLVLCAIIQAAGGCFNGKTRLYKAFYLAHLFHFRDYKGVLSDHPVVRMPKGPAVDGGNSILTELRNTGKINITSRPIGPYLEEVFILTSTISGLTEEEQKSIREAVNTIGDRTAKSLSDWTHEFSNTWDETKDGQPMNIYADLLSESEYEAMKQRHQKSQELVDAVFAG